MEPSPITRAGMPVTMHRLREEEPDAHVLAMTPEERLALVWPLTVEAWTFLGGFDAESRLPRHVVRSFRRER